MYNSITSQALSRARHQRLLDEVASRRVRRSRRANQRASARNRSVPRPGSGRPLGEPA